MIGGGNADSKWCEKKMGREDSARTVDCLRGRLLAERVASRNAKEQAEQLANKLMELENLLRQEAKSRNRAEKKLKFLLKKLESMNISYVSDESEHSGLVDKTDISSISSTTSSTTKELQENHHINTFESQEPEKNANSQKGSKNLHQNDSQNCSLSLGDERSLSSSSAFEVNFPESEMGSDEDPKSPTPLQNIAQNPADEDSLSSANDTHSERSSQLGSNQHYNDPKTDDQSLRSSEEEGLNQDGDQDTEYHIDNSMALVPIDTLQQNQTQKIDPEVLDATVKEVLDSLRHAKEQLQNSMGRRRMNMIKVG